MARNVANTRRLTFCIIVIVACITLFSILKLLYPDPSCFDNNNSYNTNSHLSHANLKELAGKVDELNQLDYNMSRYQKSEFIVHDKAYVALCMIARNEHKFIREWIQYHYFIGVQKFYIYDNLSTPPLIGTIMDFVLKGIVDVQYLTTQWKLDEFGLNKVEVKFNNVKQVNSPQRWAHADCLLNHGKNHKFIGMIDVDEFIVLNEGEEHNYSGNSSTLGASGSTGASSAPPDSSSPPDVGVSSKTTSAANPGPAPLRTKPTTNKQSTRSTWARGFA
eukprot:TRINITY_DN6420_c1_g1_i1.p4 TRINITY_DN6420_c1_g1~~TRINITY_DN6420_c1_g1_i1.p4  ORF type:complete len:298 (-),score=16.72 TRINITY_DN6420_c1_g1_i1:2481-3308(-)